MANTSSAKKAQRVALRKRIFNLRRKKEMKDAVKEIGSLISQKSAEAAKKMSVVAKAIDKAAKNGTIKKNTASRMKSRIAKRLAAMAK